jgi:carboxypeptidase C (cathepsin A)
LQRELPEKEMACVAKRLLLAFMFTLVAAPLTAQDQSKASHPPDKTAVAPTTPPNPLPPEAVTSQVLELADRTIHFTAKAGAIRLSDAKTGAPLADVAYVAFLKDGEDPAKRPLTFAINGGPGAGSAWLDLGALGPWRLPIVGAALAPSAAPVTVPNADTWLDFTDLVFIDPPATGYSRILAKDDSAAKNFFSVSGDINALAIVIRKWLAENKRLESPKFIVGESYGGFRGPKLARRLANSEGIGVDGLVLISPLLDFDWFESDNNPLTYATHLPSFTATARGLSGLNGRKELADVEAYAAGPYIVDLLRGQGDPQVLDRISAKVAGFIGLDGALVRRLAGRVDAPTFERERDRAAGRVASAYDSLVTGYDPNAHSATSHYADPVLDALKAPLASAMANIYAKRLNWFVDARYEILNEDVSQKWDWGDGHAEVIGDLKQDLALDSHFRVLIAHGLTDEVTPYFASQLLINQIPPMGDPNRLRLVVYGGGHMVYALDQSRAALRTDAQRMIEGR